MAGEPHEKKVKTLLGDDEEDEEGPDEESEEVIFPLSTLRNINF